MARVAVVLSGCGYLDGAEIHESVLCLLNLAQQGHSYHCFAPDIPQAQVTNHITQQPTDESRSVLIEAARIARGDISPLERLSATGYDALLLPGGFGAAMNLSTFATEGTECSVNADLKRAVLEFHSAGKPIGAVCIAPAAVAKIFEGAAKVKLTLGSDAQYAEKLTSMGAESAIATVDQVVVDEVNKIYSTPCYMEPPNLPGMYEGVRKLIEAMLP